MARASRCVNAFSPLVLCCSGILAVAAAPLAAADPTATGQSADAVISDLEDQGYNVEINWVGGVSTMPLSECSVKGIHNPDRSSPPAPRSTITVYVDVSCPNEPDDASVILGPIGPFGPFGIG
ncbi:hypothetical protein [Mycolicibacterium neworleansense]|uniref:PASTA domain-containing protein n=1 Tax=Mycolicibacterium neworleansense TaxID=146018 RepID=A0A0H5RGW1_9MYCO|nr:hypothetical protein [Mycolicibacterium neworleansense]MCV7362203.1 hypothetical protein [Mycolicibacterium neworleansense]CRZ13390.1 hypothetical protein BN2156_00222 [Mycolicibacterium neworleansense]